MKKSILSLSAAVALGSLGFAGSANAWVATDTAGTAATGLYLHSAGTGHQLFTPYFTANEGMATLVNVVNTDSANGKAVKVRFRGATNSDDLLDFTLFLSPGDVWAGAVLQGADGKARLVTEDKSCTLPTASSWKGGVGFVTDRLPDANSTASINAEQQAALTREGYVEVLNMADILPNTDLFKATKHVDGVAPCLDNDDYVALRGRLLSTVADNAGARADGLSNPTGGLMGSWAILDLGHMGTYSGTQTAVIAAEVPPGPNGTAIAAPGNLAFFPQEPIAAGDVSNWTADPLLTGPAGTQIITPLWFDLPDMSTPLTANTAAAQADELTAALAKTNVINEYIATGAGAEVPFTTDWVVSQPTRRYHAAVDYNAATTTAALVTRGTLPTGYSGLAVQSTDYGWQACLPLAFSPTDREEKGVASSTSGGGFSPGSATPPQRYCGEVFVAQFGATSALQAVVTNRPVPTAGGAGWASLGSNTGALPIVGYAATLFTNGLTGNKYGMTFQHRWLASVAP